MSSLNLLIAHTDPEWFDNLSRLARAMSPEGSGLLRLDEVNFWSPRSLKPINSRRFAVGEPVFFRLGAPTRKVVGYGFFADHLTHINVHLAWRLFGPKNGAPSLSVLGRILGRSSEAELRRPLGSMILRDATFWPESRWIPWGESRGYAKTGVQRGRGDEDPANIALLLGELRRDATEQPPEDLAPQFQLVADDARRQVLSERVIREGQGTFRARLLKAYEGQCAVTREHTEPVLEAAHIQRYLGPASNHVQNGLLLTQEFHTLFDRGLVCVEGRGAEYRLRVSNLLHELWNNGRRYKQYEGASLAVPDQPHLRPSLEALEWHRDVVFEKVA